MPTIEAKKLGAYYASSRRVEITEQLDFSASTFAILIVRQSSSANWKLESKERNSILRVDFHILRIYALSGDSRNEEKERGNVYKS